MIKIIQTGCCCCCSCSSCSVRSPHRLEWRTCRYGCGGRFDVSWSRITANSVHTHARAVIEKKNNRYTAAAGLLLNFNFGKGGEESFSAGCSVDNVVNFEGARYRNSPVALALLHSFALVALKLVIIFLGLKTEVGAVSIALLVSMMAWFTHDHSDRLVSFFGVVGAGYKRWGCMGMDPSCCRHRLPDASCV